MVIEQAPFVCHRTHGPAVPRSMRLMSNRVACETLDAMCSVCGVHCATWRTDDADADGYWTLDACDDAGERWLVHSDDLLDAVVLLGDMLGVDWEDG